MTVTLGLSGVFLFFLLVTGCILKIVRDRLCDSVIQTVKNITRCEEAQNKPWTSPINENSSMGEFLLLADHSSSGSAPA
ncbi:transmembrane protein 179B-like isoform X2 [Carassius gibelio]|uniref:transmembrane protein 179B-like isoform X2 n=1 Tax=Carassius gibelio TaxID=101364 RepID=UPI002278350A|nr:transmembrane protein 179B-like isoform X2 [Carassius gibelio]